MTTIGERYELGEKLGQGGMGDVYRGVDIRTGMPVAIKHLHDNISNDAQILERFRREGEALRELNHPNIVKMLDMLQHENAYYLIMEYIDGGDLADLLEARGKLPVRDAIKIALELADALSRAHHVGIIHRDIKPPNVLIASNGTPRLTDFGVARIETAERLTGTGMAVGTLDYMPPEAVNGEPVDARGDIWAFGVMLYEMLTGERPFTGDTTLALLTSIIAAPLPDVTQGCPDASPALQTLLQQMLQKDREMRLRSARQMGAALEAILQGNPVNLQQLDTPPKATASPTATMTPITEPLGDVVTQVAAPVPARRLPVWMLPAAIILLLLVGAGLILPGVFASIAPTPTPTATATTIPTATPAPTLLPVSADAPDGYQWISVDEVRLLVPTGWASLNLEAFLNISRDTYAAEGLQENYEKGIAFMERQRAFGAYIDFLSLQGLAVLVEDVGLALADDIQAQRIQDMATLAGFPVTKELKTIQLPAGEAQYFAMQGELNDLQIQMIIYAFQRDTTQYLLIFAGQTERMATLPLVMETITGSFQLVGGDAAAQTPAPTIAPISIPEGWRVASDADFSVALPAEWMALPGNIQLVESLIKISFPSADPIVLDRLRQTVKQFDIPLLFGSTSGAHPAAGGVFTTDSVLSLNFEYFEGLMIAAMTGLDSEMRLTEDVVLPGGAARHIEFLLAPPDGVSAEFLMYIIDTPDGFYLLTLFIPTTEYETTALIFDQIAQTFNAAP
jgi:hypothetical protein